MAACTVELVVPTIGRRSLAALLGSLARSGGPRPERVLLVDDRRGGPELLSDGLPEPLRGRVKVLDGPGRGPAGARNVGWRAAAAEWVAFLDDDVVVTEDWLAQLHADLAGADADVAGVQGHIHVPLPDHRRATDWERNVAGLEGARWATADLAYRRLALETVDGFDERFRRAYREDADLGLRLVRRGWRIEPGGRSVVHPVRSADRWVSLRAQAGNADDALMRACHGRGWQARAGVPAGRRGRHLGVVAAALTALLAAGAGRRRVATAAAALWAAGTVELIWARLRPGPRSAAEIAAMLLTSPPLPFAAVGHWLRGWWRIACEGSGRPRRPRPQAVLFDRDGTLAEDVPYNGDPEAVRLRPGAREALARLQRAGVATAIVTNQSGVGRGRISDEQVAAVNDRLQRLLGARLACFVCTHAPEEGCGCRKPAPGLVHEAAAALGLAPQACAVIGDIGADLRAAEAAGCRAVLVPTAETRSEEIRAAPAVALHLPAAVELLLEGEA